MAKRPKVITVLQRLLKRKYSPTDSYTDDELLLLGGDLVPDDCRAHCPEVDAAIAGCIERRFTEAKVVPISVACELGNLSARPLISVRGFDVDEEVLEEAAAIMATSRCAERWDYQIEGEEDDDV